MITKALHKQPHFSVFLVLLVSLVANLLSPTIASAQKADLIFHNAKVLTVDAGDTIAQAIAVRGDTILAVGTNDAVLDTKDANTKVIDLKGKCVIPGLIDSHTHPSGAAMHEFDHAIPDMQSIQDVVNYVRTRAQLLDDGEWVFVSQVFITRLDERRYPTRAELDEAAPANPVMFRTGPDASLNSLALKLSGIDKGFKGDGGPGHVEYDADGQPTGILRGCTRYAKYRSPKSGKSASAQDRYLRLRTLFQDYNAAGITGIADRAAGGSDVDRYQRMLDNGDLPVRIAVSRNIGTGGNVQAIQYAIRKVAEHPRAKSDKDDMLRIVGVKIFLDGGMLTGSARMRKPWGLSKIYAIDDPNYKGVFRTPTEKLAPIITTAVQNNLQFTAHSVGDGAVHALLDAYEAVNKTTPIKETRPCITHSNFMSLEAVQQMARLGVVADIQPAWLWLDTRTLSKQFDYDRMRYFQPLRTIFEHKVIAGGGSDHMQKIGARRAVNPYDPFLGMYVTITRKARDYKKRLHPEEALTRMQALRFYTMNNAYLTFREDKVGSLETGKLADFVILDNDLLACPTEAIKDIRPLATFLGGKAVYEKPKGK